MLFKFLWMMVKLINKQYELNNPTDKVQRLVPSIKRSNNSCPLITFFLFFYLMVVFEKCSVWLLDGIEGVSGYDQVVA